MDHAIFLSAALALLFLGAALLVVWSRRDIPKIRGLSIFLAVLASAASAGMLAFTLGNAVPYIAGITAPAGQATVLSSKLVIDQGIYFTLDLPDAPKLFWMPWDQKSAQALQDALDAPDSGGVAMDVPPFEWTWDANKPQFLPLPQPKVLPDKPSVDTEMAPHFAA